MTILTRRKFVVNTLAVGAALLVGLSTAQAKPALNPLNDG